MRADVVRQRRAPAVIDFYEPPAGVAVSFTGVPVSYIAVQLLPQLMPAGAELTLPLPEPVRLTVRLCWMRTNSAATDLSRSIKTVHARVLPLQAPVHPLKRKPAAGAAVRVIDVPLIYISEQSLPQSMPAGLDVTAPLPVVATPRV